MRISIATPAGSATRITGIINGAANTAYTIQVFVSQKTGGGQTLLGTLTATTDAVRELLPVAC